MHDIDLIDPPPTDLETASGEPADAPQRADPPATTDRDALLALLRILDGVHDDADGCLVVWCADAMARDAALDGRGSTESIGGARVDEATASDGQGDAERGACSPCAATDRARRQGRRSRR